MSYLNFLLLFFVLFVFDTFLLWVYLYLYLFILLYVHPAGAIHTLLTNKIADQDMNIAAYSDSSQNISPVFCSRLRKAMNSLQETIGDVCKESRVGLNAFAQYSLASLSTNVKKLRLAQHQTESTQENTFSSSMGSHRLSGSSKYFNSSGSGVNINIGSEEDVVVTLNEKIHLLSVHWEKRRMDERLREQDRITSEAAKVVDVEVVREVKEVKRHLYQSGRYCIVLITNVLVLCI